MVWKILTLSIWMTYIKDLQHKNCLLKIKNGVSILTRAGNEELNSSGKKILNLT